MNVIHLDHDYPETWLCAPAAEALRRGELIVLPTDSIYAVACDPWNTGAVARLYAAKRMDKTKRCSVMCGDLKDIGAVARGVTNDAFRFMRHHFPGPYTVLLHASRDLPKRATGRRKSIGVRVPDHPVALAVIQDYGGPVLVSSLPDWIDGHDIDPVAVAESMPVRPAVVLDQGPLSASPSTVVDFTSQPPELIRQGKGAVDLLA